MKKYKFINLLLIISVVLVSFSGCDVINKVKSWFEDEQTGGEEAWLPHFCYSVVSDEKYYDYGEEIKVTIELQTGAGFGSNIIDSKGTVRIALVESEYFEIVGESEVSFADIIPREYLCDDCSGEKGKSFVADFTIKVNDPTYIPKFVEIFAAYEVEEPNGEYVEKVRIDNTGIVDGREITVGLRFISDSQGVIVSSTPYKATTHFDKYYSEGDEYPPYYYLSPNAIIFENDSILMESFNREYTAGVSREEIMDRYIERYMEFHKSSVECYFYKPVDDDDMSFDYFSKDVRFRIYVSPDDENIKPYLENPMGDRKEDLAAILTYALSLGVISEEEYNGEVKKIYDESCKFYRDIKIDYTLEDKHHEFFDNASFPVPKGDDYFEYVFDAR